MKRAKSSGDLPPRSVMMIKGVSSGVGLGFGGWECGGGEAWDAWLDLEVEGEGDRDGVGWGFGEGVEGGEDLDLCDVGIAERCSLEELDASTMMIVVVVEVELPLRSLGNP